MRLQSGYNALVCQSIDLNTIRKGLIELLFAEGYDPNAVTLAAPGAKVTGGGLTMMCSEGLTLRLMRNLVAGSAQLMEFKKDAKKFQPITKQANEIAQLLRGRAGLPTRSVAKAAYFLSTEEMQQHTNTSPKEGQSDTVAPPPPLPVKKDPEVLNARLKEIENMLQNHEQVEQLEYEFDGLQKRLFAIEDELSTLSFDRSALEDVREQAQKLEYLDILPNDFAEQYEDYQSKLQHRETDLKRWRREREFLEKMQKNIVLEPLAKNSRLWGGFAVGMLAILIAFLLGGAFTYVALIDIPAFFVVTLVLYKNLSGREQLEGIRYKLRLSDKRREKIVSRDQKHIEAVEKALKAIEITKPEEVHNILSLKKKVHEQLAYLLDQEKQAAEDPKNWLCKKNVSSWLPVSVPQKSDS